MSRKQDPTANENFNKLIQLRQAAYQQLGNAKDAQFELCDAVIQATHIRSLAELSCRPVFRRGWSSTYEALQDGQPNRKGLMRVYVSQLPQVDRLILAGDHTAWSRLWAETTPERSYQHQPSAIPGRRPITIGHGYSTLAVIPEMEGSWALPLLHERITQQKPVLQASQQLRAVCRTLLVRAISLWDSEYSCAAFVEATADIPVDKVIRLRTNLALEGPPLPYQGRGRRRKHGPKFKLRDPATWWAPDQVLEVDDPDLGPVVVRLWSGLRFRQALECPMRVAQIERQQAPGTRRKPRILWLAWIGHPPAEQWWRLYTRRYPLDHWYRFAKGRLHWTLPMLATLEEAEHWSDLMPLITWQLWLARPVVEEYHLPWQKPQARLSPGRVCQSWTSIMLEIGTPAQAPKRRGKSPGWPKGKPRLPRPRFELLRSAQWQSIRSRQKANLGLESPKRGRPKSVFAA